MAINRPSNHTGRKKHSLSEVSLSYFNLFTFAGYRNNLFFLYKSLYFEGKTSVSSLGRLCPYMSNDWTSQSASGLLKRTSLAASSPVARDNFFGAYLILLILPITPRSRSALVPIISLSHFSLASSSRAFCLSTATSLVRMNQEQI